MALEWTESLSVGNDLIDEDHRYLISIINQVLNALEAKNVARLDYALARLIEISGYHFVREEKISSMLGYEHATHLHHTHLGLIDRIHEKRAKLLNVETEWIDDAIEVFSAFLKDWLVFHILQEDMQMKTTFQKYPASYNPFSVSDLADFS